MKENPLQYRVRGTPVPTTQTRGTNYPKSTALLLIDFPLQAFGISSLWRFNSARYRYGAMGTFD